MALHLIKLCVGVDSLSELAEWQQERLAERKRTGQPAELVHITRNTPRRAAELLDGGSLYWVIGGIITARQKLLDFRPVDRDGVPHCALVYAPQLIAVEPRPRRPFQGWRYLEAGDAPSDKAVSAKDEGASEELERELIRLGII